MRDRGHTRPRGDPCRAGDRLPWLVLLGVVMTSGCRALTAPEPWQVQLEILDQPELHLQITAVLPALREGTVLRPADGRGRSLTSLQVDGEEVRRTAEGWVVPSGGETGARRLSWTFTPAAGTRGRRRRATALPVESCQADWQSFWVIPDGTSPRTPVVLDVQADGDLSLHMAEGPTRGVVTTFVAALQVDRPCALGRLRRRTLEVKRHPSLGPSGAARVEVVFLGAPLRHPQEVTRWIHEVAQLTGDFWGGLPASRVVLLVESLPGRRGVSFGRVEPGMVPTVQCWLGAEVTAAELRKDWVLVHEMVHLGFPPVRPDARWLDEGLATWLEPLLRARAGWITQEELWTHFVDQMPRGLGALETRGLSGARRIDDVYWGGALFCLLLELETLRTTRGDQSLQQALRDLLTRSGGVTSSRCDLEALLQGLDQSLGATLAQDLARRHVGRGSPVDLDQLWQDLGVVQTAQGIRLSDSAPLAWLRRRLETGDPRQSPRPGTNGD